MFELQSYSQEQYSKLIEYLDTKEIKYDLVPHPRNSSEPAPIQTIVVDFDEFIESLNF